MSEKELKEEELEKATGGSGGLNDFQVGDWVEGPASINVYYRIEKFEESTNPGMLSKAYLSIYQYDGFHTVWGRPTVYYTPYENVTNNPVDIFGLRKPEHYPLYLENGNYDIEPGILTEIY